MKKTALRKDILREVKGSLGRFLSIFMIVAIGVAFFAGIRSSAPIMKYNADRFFDDYHLMDLQLLTTLGIDKEDVEAIKNLEQIEGIYPAYNYDVLVDNEMHQEVYELRSIPQDYQNNPAHYLNQMMLLSGRLPQNRNECVIEGDKIQISGYNVGDMITFKSGNQDELALKNDTYKIVGKVAFPYYLSNEKGNSTIGSGSVIHYAFLFEEEFKSDYFHECYVTIKEARSYNSYDDSYFDYIKPIKANVEAVVKQSVQKRYNDLYEEAKNKLDDGKKEYEDGLKQYHQAISDASKQISDGEAQIVKAQKQLDQSIKDSEQLFADKEEEIKQKQEVINQGYQTYYDGLKQYEKQAKAAQSQKDELMKQKQQLLPQQQQIAEAIAQIDAQISMVDETTLIYLQQQKQVLSQKQMELQSGLDQINQGIVIIDQQLSQGKKQLDASKKQLDDAQKQLNEGLKQLNDGKVSARASIKEGQKQLDDNRKKLEVAKKELAEEKIKGKKELDDAKKTIEDGERQLAKLKEPEVYILDRHQHYGYMEYGDAADRMGAIAKVFPLFFFLVAALVCLTTMTRMVDEKRLEIGTMKALGYTKWDIAKKFLIYALMASVSGGIFGAIVGMYIFPKVIYDTWGILYQLPAIQFSFDYTIAISAIVIATFVVVLATLLAVYKELLEVPSQLMRAKAPKNGKKIFLEYIPLLWNKLSFSIKVSARNILRYKKRFFMTVIGISGCSALLLAGFGIQDSIGNIVHLQFQEIHHFDAMLQIDNKISIEAKKTILAEIASEENVENADYMMQLHGSFEGDNEEKSIDLYVVDPNTVDTYCYIRDRKHKNVYKLGNDGVIISEKIANDNGIKVGDQIAVDNGDGVIGKLKINGICENYVDHMIYMSKDYYEKSYGEMYDENRILVNLKVVNKAKENEFGSKYLKYDEIKAASFYSGIATTFKDMVSSISIIVVVLVISAGLLAFVVLYNLSNVNISERVREIATIKVLGFYDNEVYAYVFRENFVLAFIGSFLGLIIGFFLHEIIMDLAEMENVMFGRDIFIQSYLYAIIITMIFTFIVSIVMYHKLKKIPMVESLKSIE